LNYARHALNFNVFAERAPLVYYTCLFLAKTPIAKIPAIPYNHVAQTSESKVRPVYR